MFTIDHIFIIVNITVLLNHERSAKKMSMEPNSLVRIRTKRNHSTREAARMAGVSQNTILNVEKGLTYPNLRTLTKLSDYYGLSLPDLIRAIDAINKHDLVAK